MIGQYNEMSSVPPYITATTFTSLTGSAGGTESDNLMGWYDMTGLNAY